MTETHRVLIVDDHPLFRRGLVQLLQVIPAFQLVGEAAGGAEGLALARELRPDLILLDLNMRDVSGLDVLRGLRAARMEDHRERQPEADVEDRPDRREHPARRGDRRQVERGEPAIAITAVRQQPRQAAREDDRRDGH